MGDKTPERRINLLYRIQSQSIEAFISPALIMQSAAK